MDNKKIISVSLLIIALSMAYYFVIFLPQKENQKIELQRFEAEQKRLEVKQQVEQQKEQEDSKLRLLTQCLNQAGENYHTNWFSECKSQGKLSATCIKLMEMTFEEYIKENNIPDNKRVEAVSEFYDKRDDCSCRLPSDNARRIEGWEEDAKDECFKKYPQN